MPDRRFEGPGFSANCANAHTRLFGYNAAEQINAFFSPENALSRTYSTDSHFADFAGENDVHVRKHLKGRLNRRCAGEQAHTLHSRLRIAHDAKPAARLARAFLYSPPTCRA